MPAARPLRLRLPAALARWLLAAGLVLVAGCSPYKLVGDQLMRFSEKVILPHELAGTDIGIGCKAAQAFTAPTVAFEGVGTDVNRIAVLLWLTSGVCTEFDALEQELTFLRAMRMQDPNPALDARIAQKHLHALAARRQLNAWNRFEIQFGTGRGGKCPAFKSDFEELVFLVGLLSGVQAMMNDAQAGQVVGVSRDIAPRVGHLAACLDSRKWWDLPLAIRSALWAIVPMLAPEGVDPMKTLQDISRRGEQDGLRLGYVVWTMVAYSGGDRATAQQAMREFADVGRRFTPNAEYRILDVFAERLMLAVSDRLWTEAAGHRTPMGGLGTFPDDAPPPASDISDLL